MDENNIIICEKCYEENENSRTTCKNCGAKLYKRKIAQDNEDIKQEEIKITQNNNNNESKGDVRKMALIKCEVCGKEIAQNAVSCPHCGAKNKNNNETASIGIKVICFLIPLIGIIIFAINISTRPKYAKGCLIASLLPTIILIIILLFVFGSNLIIVDKGIFSGIEKTQIIDEDIKKVRESLIDDSSISIYKGNKAYEEDGNKYAGDESRIVAVKSDGTVIAIGNSDNGICNVSNWKNIKSVSTSYTHTVGLKEDGTVVATGLNTYGQCNVSKWKDIVKVIAINGTTIGLKKDGTIVVTGENNNEYRKAVNNWKNIIDIIAYDSYDDILGITSDGNIMSAFDVGHSVKGYYTDKLKDKLNDFKNICKLYYERDSHIFGIKKDKTLVSTDSTETLKDIIYFKDNAVYNAYWITNKGTVGYSNDFNTTMDTENIKNWKNLIYLNMYYQDLELNNYYYIGITKEGKILDTGNNQILDFSDLTDLKIVKDNKNKLY